MYLTRLALNPRSRQVQREIAEPYQMHRTISNAFPEEMPESERVLFRLDSQAHTGALPLLVQSIGQPDWSFLEHEQRRSYLLESDEPNPMMKHFEPQFSKGRMLAFRLRANPTVKRSGKRLGLYREEEQLEWLERKAIDHGFRLAAVRIAKDEIIDGWLKRDEERHKLRLLAVRFDGVLQVDDPERFLQAVRDGIGSGKGLGCGLLSLARV